MDEVLLGHIGHSVGDLCRVVGQLDRCYHLHISLAVGLITNTNKIEEVNNKSTLFFLSF